MFNIIQSDLQELPLSIFISLVREFSRLGVVTISISSSSRGFFVLVANPIFPISSISTKPYSEITVNSVKDYFRKLLNFNIIISNF